jgi:flagellar biosynthetic protein FliR
MPVELLVSPTQLLGALLVLARTSGVVALVPIPGLQAAPESAKIALALCLTVMLFPVWPSVAGDIMPGRLVGAISSELLFGLLIGVSTAFLLESFQVAAQMVGLQAGYSFASTVDPSTQADSAVLQVGMQLFSGLLFFAIGADREVIRVLADTIATHASVPTAASLAFVVGLGSKCFTFGVRLALPIVAVLLLVDISFAVLNKVHMQFQITSLSFSAKMLAGLVLLGVAIGSYPQVCERIAGQTIHAIYRLVGH